MERQVHARAEAEWQRALELEKKLKASSRKRSFYDPEVRSLRKQLRDTYESLLFLDAAFSAANDVEGQLWRTVFYLPIEEFRARIRKAGKEVQHRNVSTAAAAPDAAAILAKTAAAFLKFLDESALFYKRMVMQLQSAYGDVKVRLELPPGVPAVRSTGAAADGADGMQMSTGSSIARDMRASIHRCLVFLGDLARYASQAAPKAAAAVAAGGSGGAANTAAKAEWNRAISYYRMAAHVLPRSGNPHNQLAVMAFMSGEELKAAYHYARSLCVHVPFMTARENLLQLLQSNRDRYNTLCKQRQQEQQLQQPGQGRPVLPMQQQLAELGVCYVRLCGLLYDRINQHEYPPVAKDAFEALASFLDHPQLLALLQRQRQHDCTPLHLVVLSIFMVHHSFGGVGAGGSSQHGPRQQDPEQHAANSKPSTADASAAAAAAIANGTGRDSSSGGFKTYAGGPGPLSPIAAAPAAGHGDAAQRCAQRGRSLAMLFRTGRLLAQAATAAVNAEAAAAVSAGANNGVAAAAAAGKTGATCLLVGLNVALQWLAAQPNCAVLQAASATEEDVKARSKFWSAAAQLLLVLAPALSLYSDQQRQQQLTGAAASSGVGGDVRPCSSAGGAAGSAGGRVSGSMGADASCEEGALPEDLELLGFEPMRSRHYWHVTDVGKHAVDETQTRIKRMLAAARVTSAALAADQQQQMARHLHCNISTQALNQLGMSVQQFVEVVAMLTATRTPTASPKVPTAAGVAPAAAAVAAGSSSPWAAAVAVREQQQQQQGVAATAAAHRAASSVTSMDLDTEVAHEQPRGPSPGAAAAAATRNDIEECEEEVIVFKPRTSRLSSPAVEDAMLSSPKAAEAGALSSPAGGGAAAGRGGSGASSKQMQMSAAAAGPPPLPQTLLAGRQPGASPSASSSPMLRSPGQQQQQQLITAEQLGQAVQRAAAATAAGAAASRFGSSGLAGDAASEEGLGSQHGALANGRGSQCNAFGSAGGFKAGGMGAAGLPAAAAPAASGGLLQGHAATALDLQQAQAASDMLLARLNAQSAVGGPVGAAAAAPGFGAGGSVGMGVGAGGGMLQLHQQQQRPANGYGGLTPTALVTQAAPHNSAPPAQMAGGGLPFGLSDDDATAQALLGSGLASLLGGLGEELLLEHQQAVGGAGAGRAAGGLSGLAGGAGGGRIGPSFATAQPASRQGQFGEGDALAAVNAAVAASMEAAGLQGRMAGNSTLHQTSHAPASAMGGGLDDPLAALGVLGIPTDVLGLSVGVPGGGGPVSTAAGTAGSYMPGIGGSGAAGLPSAAFHHGGGLQGPEGYSLGGGVPVRSVSANAATTTASAAIAAAERKSSAPVSILQQYAAGAAAGSGEQESGQQAVLSSSYIAHHQMEATALGAAARVLSPDTNDTGLGLLQQHQHQQLQQHQQQVPSSEPPGSNAAAFNALAGGWMSGSASSTPRAATPRSGGLSTALQQQQQLQAQMAQRRFSGGTASPRSAVGAERAQQHHHQGDGSLQQQGITAATDAGTASISRPGRAAAAQAFGGPAGEQQQQQPLRPQRSSISAMFAGPDLFAPSEQLPPMHRRMSSGGSSGVLMGATAAAGAAGGVRPADVSAAPGAQADRLYAGGPTAQEGSVMADEDGLLPAFFGEVLQQPGNSVAATGAAPAVLQRQPQQQQQQQQLGVVAESPDQADGGLTLVEYLAAQQRKLQQQGAWVDDRSIGLQAAAAAGADLSAHVLLPPLDCVESQDPFG